jgi:uncharacterized repeat protein (TIGR03803 family)
LFLKFRSLKLMKSYKHTKRNRSSVSRSAARGTRALFESFEPRVLMTSVVTDLAGFNGTTTGCGPDSSLIRDAHGNVYGTTSRGGANSLGTVYEVAAGSGTITTIASFTSLSGYNTETGLVMDASGNLYGTTPQGGANFEGTVFEVAAGSSTVTPLASFTSGNFNQGSSGVVIDAHGNLYGTTYEGGTNSQGSVFEVVHNSGAITTLASFGSSTGTYPSSGLVMDSAGNLFGTTSRGGVNSSGTIFELATGGSSITELASLSTGNEFDQSAPLAIDSHGNLFGTTAFGGTSFDGTVYELANGSSTVATLVSFNGTDGGNPSAGLLIDSSGDLYGTTTRGGNPSYYPNVFEVAAGSGTITTIAQFNGTDGNTGFDLDEGDDLNGIMPSVIMDAQGNLYGAAPEGGPNGYYGAVYEIAPPATQTVITTQPATTVTAGTPQSISVSLNTAAGLLSNLTQSTVTLSIGNGPQGATLGGTLSVAAVNGVANFSGLTFDTAGVYTITTSDGLLTPATTTTITVVPAAAAAAIFIQQPTDTVAGQTIGTVEAQVQDAFGNLITNDNSMVTLSSDTALGGTATVQAIGGLAEFTDLSMTSAGAHTLAVADGLLTPATSNSFNITPGPADQLAFVQQPTDTVAGQTIPTVQVDVEDAFGNIVTADNSNVTLSGDSSLSGTTTVQAASGVATFSDLSLTHAGLQTLSASDEDIASATSDSFNVIPAAANQLAINAQPNTAGAGAVLGTVVVAVEDTYGNIVTSDNSNVVIAAESTPSVLTGTATIAAVNGVATFSDLSLTPDGIYTLDATDGVLTDAATSPITVTDIPTISTVVQNVSTSTHAVTLSILGADTSELGQSGLTYTWSVSRAPSGAKAVTLNENGTNAAKGATASFRKAGTYHLSCTIANGAGNSVNATVSVTVMQVATKLRLTPHGATIPTGSSLQYGGVMLDQFGHPMRTTQTVAYAVKSGGGTIDQDGLFTAGQTKGHVLIQITVADLIGTLGATIV